MTIRLATPTDLPALGRLGALLMRTHYGFDPQRFMDPGTDPADGYAWFLGKQLKDDDCVIFVADNGGTVIGYYTAYAFGVRRRISAWQSRALRAI